MRPRSKKSQSATTTKTRENSTCSSGWPSARQSSGQSRKSWHTAQSRGTSVAIRFNRMFHHMRIQYSHMRIPVLLSPCLHAWMPTSPLEPTPALQLLPRSRCLLRTWETKPRDCSCCSSRGFLRYASRIGPPPPSMTSLRERRVPGTDEQRSQVAIEGVHTEVPTPPVPGIHQRSPACLHGVCDLRMCASSLVYTCD